MQGVPHTTKVVISERVLVCVKKQSSPREVCGPKPDPTSKRKTVVTKSCAIYDAPAYL